MLIKKVFMMSSEYAGFMSLVLLIVSITTAGTRKTLFLILFYCFGMGDTTLFQLILMQMKMKIPLMLLKGDSSYERLSHLREKPADQKTSVYYIQ